VIVTAALQVGRNKLCMLGVMTVSPFQGYFYNYVSIFHHFEEVITDENEM